MVEGFEMDNFGEYSPQSYRDVKLARAYRLAVEDAYNDFYLPERTQLFSMCDLFI